VKRKMMIINQSKGGWGDGMGKTDGCRRANQYSFNRKTYNS
jgi:hypothetical protein